MWLLARTNARKRTQTNVHTHTRTHTQTTQITCHVNLFRLLVPVKQWNRPTYSSVGHHFALVSKVHGYASLLGAAWKHGKMCTWYACADTAGWGGAGGNTLRCHRETILRCYSQRNVKNITTHITRSFSGVSSVAIGQSVSRSCDAAASLHAHKHFRDRRLWRRES